MTQMKTGSCIFKLWPFKLKDSPCMLMWLCYDFTWQKFFPFPYRVSRVEEAAFQALRERLFAHRTDLNSAFRKLDKKETGEATEGRTSATYASAHAPPQ